MNSLSVPRLPWSSVRPSINSGDILLQRGSKVLGGITRFVTRCDFAHIGLLWNYGTGNYFAEAEPLRGVRLSPLHKNVPGRLIRLGWPELQDADKDAIFSVMGALYDVEDAIRAGFFLKPINPGRLECAEFVLRFLSLRYTGLPDIPTPATILKWAQNNNLPMIDVY